MNADERTTHANTQTVGLTLVAASFAVVMIASLILLGGDDIAPFVVFTIVVAAAAFLTWRFDRTWSKIVGLVASVLALGGFFLGFGIFQIFSPLEFVAGLAYVMGWFLSMVGGIRAIIAGRRDRVGGTKGETRLPKVVLAILGVAAVISIAGFFATKQTVSDADAAGATTVEMVNFEFTPEALNVDAASTLLVRNTDPFVHDIAIDDLDIAQTVGPGSEVLVDLDGAAAGTYTYVCTLHSSDGEGMVGTITIGG
jgi:plastocyanin